MGFVFGLGLDFLWFCGSLTLELTGAMAFLRNAFGGWIDSLYVILTYQGFGIAQWIVVGPALIYFWRRQQTKTAHGLLCQAVLMMLVNFYQWAARGGLPPLLR
jgi:GNAT superfamily N-acetyltransferase